MARYVLDTGLIKLHMPSVPVFQRDDGGQQSGGAQQLGAGSRWALVREQGRRQAVFCMSVPSQLLRRRAVLQRLHERAGMSTSRLLHVCPQRQLLQRRAMLQRLPPHPAAFKGTPKEGTFLHFGNLSAAGMLRHYGLHHPTDWLRAAACALSTCQLGTCHTHALAPD